jgi:ABC-2 type transport system permease protein
LADSEDPGAPQDDAAGPTSDSDAVDGSDDEDGQPVVSMVVDHSPDSARLILFSSPTFLSDTAIGLATEATQSRYLAPLTLIQNAIDWSLEDRGLLALRGRGQYSRLLEPIGREQRILLETLNYILALGGLGLVYLAHRTLRRRRARALAAMLEG